MAMRSTASFAISFGLVNIDCKGYKPYNDPADGISFNQLHGASNDKGTMCHSRLNQIMFCPACEKKVEASDIVKGYEYEKEKYLIVTADELKALDGEKTRSLTVERVVSEDDVNSIYFTKYMWYLAPGGETVKQKKDVAEAFATFRDGIIGMMAIGTYISDGHDHQVAIFPQDNGLVMRGIIAHAELRNINEVPGYDAIPAQGNPKYAKLMNQLVTANLGEFAPTSVINTRAEAKAKLVESKKPGGAAYVPTVAEEAVVDEGDLMARLEKSLKVVNKPKQSKVVAIKRTRKKAA